MYVIAKGYYGLGGNLAVLVCAMRLARKLNRHLIVDWKYGFYGGDSHDVYGELFQAPSSFPVERGSWESWKVWPDYWQPYVAQTKPYPKGVPLSYVTTEMAESEADAGGSLGDAIIISRDDKYWHKGEHHEEMSLLTQSLVPSVASQNLIEQYKSLFLGQPVIGVHFRHGNGERTVVPPDINWFYSQVDKFVERAPGCKIFLCSDCYAALRSFTERYGNRVISTDKNYPALGSGGMHYGDTDVKRLASAREALLDIWLLAECTYFVGSKSFFSGVAGKLNGGFGRENSAWWTPRHRSFSADPEMKALSTDADLLQSFHDNNVSIDGIYYKTGEGEDLNMYYLYDYLGSLSKTREASSLQSIFGEIKSRRLY